MSGTDNIIKSDAELICREINFSILENKTILITGASGLLGSYLLMCLKVLETRVKNIHVVAVFRSAFPDFIAKENLQNLSIFKGDISDYEFCQKLPDADYIIHAAGYAQPLKFMSEASTTLKMNTFSTFLLLDKLKEGGHFVFISSSEVYNGLDKEFYREEDIGTTNTTHPRACYIEGKRGGETICNAYRAKGVKASSVRLAHTYGPGAKKGDQRVILSFIEKALNGKIELLDEGKAIRTYCYVSDAVEIIWRVLFSVKEPVYNLGGNSQTSIAGAAEKIGAIMNVPVLIPQKSISVSGAPTDVQLDMSKVKNEFGKQSYVTLDDGLRRTISWYIGKENNN